MRFEEFRKSKWVKAAQDPRSESRLRSAFPKWKNRVKNLNLLSRAGELWSYFISGSCSATNKMLVMGALIYLVSPIDLVPDYIPVIGWLDDVGVATAVLAFLNGKLDAMSEIDNTSPDSMEETGSGKDPFRDLMMREKPNLGDDPYSGLLRRTRLDDDPFADLLGDKAARK